MSTAVEDSARVSVTDANLAASPQPGLVEIGWLVSDRLDDVDQEAIEAARQCVIAFLRDRLPDYEWRIVIEVREHPTESRTREPAEFLNWAQNQRLVRGWDYAFTFVEPDLRAWQRSYAWACISRSLDSAVISTARIDPRADDPESSPRERSRRLTERLQTLALRCLGHLCGLSRVEDATNVMGDFRDLTELDHGRTLTAGQLEQMSDNLSRIADMRLEEEQSSLSWWSFYPRAAWRNRMEIVAGLRQAHAWQMPIRSSRLTIAALTTMLVLIMTAEAWELGTRQTLAAVVGVSFVSLVATIAYVLNRQGLLLHRRHAGLSEQIVTMNLTTIAILTAGILTTYICLFLLTLSISFALFDARLVASWAASLEVDVAWTHYWTFAGFVSSVGIVIGALGASFEGQHYFRHITYVDEEV